MKPWLIFGVTLTCLVGSICPLPGAIPGEEEERLIQVLQGNASLSEKDAACARLKVIGTVRSVAALAALLPDDQLSHSARYALESMQCAEAGTALVLALNSTTGATRIGIINSLGARGVREAVPVLVPLLRGSDDAAAIAAARGLGQIGGTEALAELQTASQAAKEPVRAAAVDGVLRCANHLLASGNHPQALRVFEELNSAKEADWVRLAAYRGMIQASGDAGLKLMVRAISGGTGPELEAALQLVRDFPANGTTRELTKLLPRAKPEVQIALIEGLAQRGDATAAPAIAALASDAVAPVRLAILNALGVLGSAADVALLSGFAASPNATEHNAARRALARLRGTEVTESLLSQLATSPPAIQAELARALGYRADVSAIPKLLDLASGPDGSVRRESLKALAILVGAQQVPALVDLVTKSGDQSSRQEAAEALNTAYQRFQGRKGSVPVGPLVGALNTGTPEVREVLLPICSGLPHPEVRTGLRACLTDGDPKVHAAAVRALCDTVDAELLEDLVQVARAEKREQLRTLAYAGTVRLATQEEGTRISREQQAAILKSLLDAASTKEQKRIVLAGLAEVPTSDTLGLVGSSLEDEAVRNEAARAAVKIGLALPSHEAQPTIAVLRKALAAAPDESTQKAVEAALKQIEASADYITDWQISGPYRQSGKDFSALFDAVFPPEMGDGSGASWRTLTAGTDPKRPWVVDLLKAMGGEQCVAYARTWVHSEKDQPVRLEIGSDDGAKVWLNEKVVYSLNTARPLQPGSDKADVTLHSGWNLLLFKVTQNNQGWEFCARLLSPEGAHLEGVQCGSSVKTDASPAK